MLMKKIVNNDITKDLPKQLVWKVSFLGEFFDKQGFESLAQTKEAAIILNDIWPLFMYMARLKY